jgi:hypothetical protein
MKCPICGVSRYERSYNHVYADTMTTKIKNKCKTAIGLESVGDETDPDKEDNMKRKISVLVMWYLLQIDRKKVDPYWSHGGTCFPRVSTPILRSLADSSMTNHIT